MPLIRIYIETSVWSHWFATEVPEMQKATREFLERCRRRRELLELVVSEVVVGEVQQSSPEKARLLADLLQSFRPTILRRNDAVRDLAEAYISHGAIPPSKLPDALHAAFATVHECEMLVSWNYRHLVNVARRHRIAGVSALMGYSKVVEIVAPPEVPDDVI